MWSSVSLNQEGFLLQVANDGPGAQILAELQGDGVDTSNVVVRHGPGATLSSVP